MEARSNSNGVVVFYLKSSSKSQKTVTIFKFLDPENL